MPPVISLSLPFVRVQHPHYLSKLLSLCLTFCPVFVILSISTEGLFYAAYCSVLVLWVAVEAAVREPDAQPGQERKDWRHDVYRPRADDMRIALFFLFLVQVGFFGTGK
jgi:phosphatidylinositol glycan class N